MKCYLKLVWFGFKFLVIGFGIIWCNMFKKLVILEYLYEKFELSLVYWGAIKFIEFEEFQLYDCVGCKQCEWICFFFCIKVEGGKVEGIKKKWVDFFMMDFVFCSLCGLCIDVCFIIILEYLCYYDVVGYECYGFVYDFLVFFQDYEFEF